MATIITAAELESLVSVERFASFRHATPAPEAAVALYTWNARVTGAFGELLHHVEVLVRNAMHSQLTILHSQAPGRPANKAWFDEPSWVKHHWFHHHARTQIAKAAKRARHGPTNPRPGKVLASLNFGFWRYLASARYEQSFWVPALDYAFAAPGSHPQIRRQAVEQRLLYLHILRNRISHCEPIIHPIQHMSPGHPSKALKELYTDAIQLVSFISPVAAHWLKDETRHLPRLLETQSRHMR